MKYLLITLLFFGNVFVFGYYFETVQNATQNSADFQYNLSNKSIEYTLLADDFTYLREENLLTLVDKNNSDNTVTLRLFEFFGGSQLEGWVGDELRIIPPPDCVKLKIVQSLQTNSLNFLGCE